MYEDFDNDDGLIKWCNSYKQHKGQRAQIKEELISIACHLTKMQDW